MGRLSTITAPASARGPRYGTQDWCDWRNSTMERNDIEWALDGKGGAYLRDRADWTAHHTKELARSAEEERRRWIWRHRNPQALTGDAAA